MRSIATKLQLVFVPALLATAVLIYLIQSEAITELYVANHEERLTSEAKATEYVLDVYLKELQDQSVRTAEVRGLLDALKAEDLEGVATELSERMTLEGLDFGFVVAGRDDKLEVLARGHNLRYRRGDAFPIEHLLAIWGEGAVSGRDRGRSWIGAANWSKKDVEVELGDVLSQEARDKLQDQVIAYAVAPITSYGQPIAHVLVAVKLSDNATLESRITRLISSNADLSHGILLTRGGNRFLAVGRAKRLPAGPLPPPGAADGEVGIRLSDGSIVSASSHALAGLAIELDVLADRQDLAAAVARNKRRTSGVVLGVTLLLIILVALTARVLFAPIRQLAQASESMASGQYATRVQVKAHDEIASLSRSFNHMAGSIEASIAAIRSREDDLIRKNRDISRISEIVQELSQMSDAFEIRRRIAKHGQELTQADGYLLVERMSSGASRVLANEHVPADVEGSLQAASYVGGRVPGCIHRNLSVRAPHVDLQEHTLILYRGDGAFEPSSLDLLEACVHAGAIAIENLGRIAMQVEMETARIVQTSLFPAAEVANRDCRTSSYYFSPGNVGGDWYGYVERERDTMIFVADATGHGASAALITAVARSAVSSVMSIGSITSSKNPDVRPVEFGPGEYVEHLNRMIAESGRGRVLMTGLAVRISGRERQLEVCNAGHPHPFLYDPKSGQLRVLGAFGHVLGLDMESAYANKSFSYEPGSLLLVYTDGLSEARNAAGKQRGIKFLKEVFGAHGHRGLEAMRLGILRGLEEFQGGAPILDDVTFVLAELA